MITLNIMVRKNIIKYSSRFNLGHNFKKQIKLDKKQSSLFNEFKLLNYKINSLSKQIQDIQEVIYKKTSKESYIYPVLIHGELFYFSDSISSITVNYITRKMNQDERYDYRKIDFKEGDCVIDIGGHVGMVSIYLAKKFPFLKIYAFEPVKENYENFLKNIKLNNIPDGTIIVENKAVTSDGRNVSMNIGTINKGGCCMYNLGDMSKFYINEFDNSNIPSTTLNDIFKKYNIKKLKMLKVDCEGAEFEILYNTSPEILKNIEILECEFHDNKLGDSYNSKYNSRDLLNFLSQYIKDIKVRAYYGWG